MGDPQLGRILEKEGSLKTDDRCEEGEKKSE